MEIGYTGSRGLKFPFDNQINTLPPQYLALGNSLRDSVSNPFVGQISKGILSTATVSRAQLLRPYPQYDTVNAIQSSLANSTYHALEVKGEKRYSRGLTLLLSYTYSKNMDLGIGSFSGDSTSAGSIQDYFNLHNEYAPSALDQTHRVIANAVYEFPFFSRQQGIFGRMLGGWEVGAILSLYSGSPLGITQQTNNTFSQGGGQRPNWIGINARIDSATVDHWFDIPQFTNAPSYAYGNVARTLGGLRSDGLQQLDATLTKNTIIHENLKLQFRAEFFNFTNTPQFAAPGTALGANTFGVVSSQNNQPRVAQFALKLLF